MKHKARKRFGQNFLQDMEIINRIVDAIRPAELGNLIEIGPGQGALTFPLIDVCGNLTVIELDRDLVTMLQKSSYSNRLNILSQDVLTVDFTQFTGPLRVVGNLPYNISTPIMMHLLKSSADIKDMHFMLQKEVIDRLAAEPSSKQYGRLSVVTQFCCDVYPLFDVPPNSFYPAPKVMSGIVRLVPKKLSETELAVFDSLQALVKQAFATRRKTLRNNLKGVLTNAEFDEIAIDPSQRPEQLTVDDYVKVASFLLSK